MARAPGTGGSAVATRQPERGGGTTVTRQGRASSPSTKKNTLVPFQ